MGLALSLCAAILWAVYEIILDVVPPVPSLADIFSIFAYAFLSFYMFSTYLRKVATNMTNDKEPFGWIKTNR